MKMGILSPDSALSPNFGHQFTNALKKSGPGSGVTWLTESVGNGSNLNRVESAIENMLQVEEVDILILFLEFKIIEQIMPLLGDSSKLFIVINTGANYPADWTPKDNLVFLHLNQSFCSRLTGNIAGAQFREAILVSTIYDAQYLQTEVMWSSFERQDGKLVQRFISKSEFNKAPDQGEVEAVFSVITKPTAVLLVSDYEPGLALLKAMAKLPTAEHLSIFAAPMVLNGGKLPVPEKGWPFSITGYIPWFTGDDKSRYQIFGTSLIDTDSEKQDIFGLLGWETGMLLHEWFAVAGRNPSKWDATKLLGVALSSPRGILSFDPVNHHFSAPVTHLHLPKQSQDWEIESDIDFEQEWAIFSRYGNQHDGMKGSAKTYPCY